MGWDIIPEGKYRYILTSLELLPDWCRKAVESFLEQKRREFRAHGTVRTYQYPCIRFCRLLIGQGCDSFQLFSPAVVKELAHQEQHATFTGRSETNPKVWITRSTNLYRDGAELELISRILGHTSTETPRLNAIPSVEMMWNVMETGKLSTDETPQWPDDEVELARQCGLR